jgi:hypothetical protein
VRAKSLETSSFLSKIPLFLLGLGLMECGDEGQGPKGRDKGFL